MGISAKTGFSKRDDSFEAAVEAASAVHAKLNNPDLIILFSSILHDSEAVLKGVRSIFKTPILIGGTTFGELTNHGMRNESVAVMGVKADQIGFHAGLGSGSDSDPLRTGKDAANSVVAELGNTAPQMGLVITEMIGGYKVFRGIQNVLSPEFALFGGCASGNRKVPIDNPDFTRGYQYSGNDVHDHSTPLVLMSGNFKYGFGVGHGWRPLGNSAIVGQSLGNQIDYIGEESAKAFYTRYLGDALFTPYPLGFNRGGHLHLRVASGVTKGGGVLFTTEIPSGTEVRITRARRDDIFKASEAAAQQALAALDGAKPAFGIIISCISRRNMLGSRLPQELEIIQSILGKDLPLIGGYCAGEYAPVRGESYYHNCSCCIALIGENIPEDASKTVHTPVINVIPPSAVDKIVFFTQDETVMSACRLALAQSNVHVEQRQKAVAESDWIRDEDIKIIVAGIEEKEMIKDTRRRNANVQFILLVDNQSASALAATIDELGEYICGYCVTPIKAFELRFLVQKALKMNQMSADNARRREQLADMAMSLEEAEEHIEVTERVLTQSFREVEESRDSFEQKVKDRTRELEAHLQTITRQQEAITELSTPVLKIWDNILALPIVGILDTRRSMEIMDTLLNCIEETQSRFVIIDVTGIRIIDTKTADYLIKVTRACQLLGAESVLTGLNPVVSQMMIEIGVELTGLHTMQSLKKGLQYCIRVNHEKFSGSADMDHFVNLK